MEEWGQEVTMEERDRHVFQWRNGVPGGSSIKQWGILYVEVPLWRNGTKKFLFGGTGLRGSSLDE